MSLTIHPARIVEESSSPLLAAHESWERRPLGEVADIINGFAFPSNQFKPGAGKPLIRIRDIFNTATAVGFVGDYDRRHLVRPGELLVGMDGDFNCARWKGPEGLLNQRVCKVMPRPEQLNLDFLTHVLPGYLQAIHDLTSSTTVTHLSSRDLAQLPIPVPPLDVQRGVAAALNQGHALNVSALAHLAVAQRASERFRQAALAAACSGRLTADWRNRRDHRESAKKLLTRIHDHRAQLAGSRYQAPTALDTSDLPELPQEWQWTSCEAICRPDRALTYGVIKLGAPVIGGVPTLRSSDVRHLYIEDDHIKQIDPAISAAYRRTVLQGGELVVTVRGTLGGVAVVPEHMAGYNVSREVAVVPLVSEVEATFYAYVVASLPSQNWLAHVSKGVAYTGINIEDLKRLPIPLPPLAEQREIVHRVRQLLDLADGLRRRIEAASRSIDRSSQAVLAKAFRGELVPAGIESAATSEPSGG